MRKAAGVLLIVGGLALLAPNIGMLGSSLVFPVMGIVVAIFTVGGGICALSRRAYWWALAASICVIVMALFAAVYEANHYTIFFPRHMPPFVVQRVLTHVAAGVLFGLPGVLAHVFLVKRREEFRA